MAWTLPYSVEDTADSWQDETNALDGDSTTVATVRPIAPSVRTGFLILNFSPITTTKLAFYVVLKEALVHFDVWFRSGGEWRRWGSFHNETGDRLYESEFIEQDLDGIRIDFEFPTEYTPGVGVAFCKLEYTCRGPLVAICDFLRGVGTFFVDLAADIREVWVVGEYLATPFELLAELFYDASELCCQASAALQDILNALEHGITAEAILALIQDNWPTLYSLITDPVDWFLVQLTLAFDLDPWHTQSIEFLAKWILQEYFPALYDLWLDLADGFLGLLQKRAPILYYLVVDPEGQARYLIGQWFDLEPFQVGSWALIFKALMERFFPELWELYLDPETWLRERVLALIQEFTEDIAGFLDNAWDWLLDQYEDAFESIQARLYVLAEKTLRFFWEGEW